MVVVVVDTVDVVVGSANALLAGGGFGESLGSS